MDIKDVLLLAISLLLGASVTLNVSLIRPLQRTASETLPRQVEAEPTVTRAEAPAPAPAPAVADKDIGNSERIVKQLTQLLEYTGEEEPEYEQG